jgi:hypothetical protein
MNMTKQKEPTMQTRRQMLKHTLAGSAAITVTAVSINQVVAWQDSTVSTEQTVKPDSEPFELRYILASCMYGYMYVGEILPEVAKAGATHIDLWPKRHGNQREQLTDLGAVCTGTVRS